MNLTTGNRLNTRAARMLALLLAALLWIWFTFGGAPGDASLFRSARTTKTALALTSDALLGPFPTATKPTATPSDLPTLTPTIPTATPSFTVTPSPTVTFISTATPRTRVPGPTLTGVIPTFQPTATRIAPTRTSVPPTRTSVPPTSVPPTSVPPTEPPPPTTPPIIPTDVISPILTLLPPLP
ncbi:MAG TPA: hypothetical protein VJ821_11040 [Anaerolineales bacterium]|nr:hypothetical protein [Anaerolineales bacterium]